MTLRLDLRIHLDTPAFNEDASGELSRILHLVADDVRRSYDPDEDITTALMDADGNQVGEWRIVDEWAEEAATSEGDTTV